MIVRGFVQKVSCLPFLRGVKNGCLLTIFHTLFTFPQVTFGIEQQFCKQKPHTERNSS